jgi:hypothetical protein
MAAAPHHLIPAHQHAVHGVRLAAEHETVQHGGTLARIPLRDFKPVQQVASVRPRGDGIEITVATGDNDPQLYLDLPAPLHVTAPWLDFARTALPVALPVFGALALLLFLLDRAAALRTRLAAFGTWLGARPAAAGCVGSTSCRSTPASRPPT